MDYILNCQACTLEYSRTDIQVCRIADGYLRGWYYLDVMKVLKAAEARDVYKYRTSECHFWWRQAGSISTAWPHGNFPKQSDDSWFRSHLNNLCGDRRAALQHSQICNTSVPCGTVELDGDFRPTFQNCTWVPVLWRKKSHANCPIW